MYAQKNYSEKMGFVESAQGQVAGPGPYTISQIGCFLTAFSNLAIRLGISVDPNVLNIFFTEHKAYMADPGDGKNVYDDLGWSSITTYDPTITVSNTGAASWPSSDNAIVEFRFEENGQIITHFCLVESVANRTIVDSYDGQIKQPGKYGAPVAWATYIKNSPRSVPTSYPQTPTPPPKPAVGPSYEVVNTLRGYMTATNAATHTSVASTVAPGKYFIYNQASGMVNVSTTATVPGSWINPSDNVTVPIAVNGDKEIVVQVGWGLERIAQAAGRSDYAQPTCWATIAAANGSNNWGAFNSALKPGQHVKVPAQGAHGETDPQDFTVSKQGTGNYRATKDATITDLKNPNSKGYLLDTGTKVGIVGTFMVDGTEYGLPKFSNNGKMYYGVPMDMLEPIVAPNTHESFHDKTVVLGASLFGILKRHKAVKTLKKAN